MPRQQGAADAIRRRRAEVARLYCQGWPQHRIGAKFGVTHQQIGKDLSVIRAEWRRVMVEEYDRIKDEQLAKLDETERQAWRGWRRSLRDAERVTSKRDLAPPQVPEADPDNSDNPVSQATVAPQQIGPAEETTVREGQAGDPRFLQIVMDCIDKRLRLVGGYPDSKDKGPPVIAELVLRVLGPGLSMSDLCGGRVLNGRDANPEG
jgi:hypothetical protein